MISDLCKLACTSIRIPYHLNRKPSWGIAVLTLSREGGPELTIQGEGAKTPALHILAISWSFQVRLEWYQKQI